MSLRRLGVERIDLYQLHRVDDRVPLAEQLGALVDLQREGKIDMLGLSEVGVEVLAEAGTMAEIATVQNLFNVGHRAHQDVVAACEADGIGFIPWFPIAGGELVADGSPLIALAEQTGATPAQLSIAWLLRHSPAILPIPGTGRVAHLEENCAAADVVLDDDQWAVLDALA
jgi:aryl-alcohol dehydrogenase-like predicted oxidoreductase